MAVAVGLMAGEQRSKGGGEQGGALPSPENKRAYVRQMFGRIARRYDLMNRLMTLGRDRAWRRYTISQIVKRQSSNVNRQTSSVKRRASNVKRQTSNVNRQSSIVNHKILDVATGTGDLALEVLRQHPEAEVVGLDFTPEMLALARQKIIPPLSNTQCPISLVAGDALRLPFPDSTFDAVVTGFALRNVTDIAAAFGEMARVTRPGGRIACLEITQPRWPIWRRLYALYFYRLVPLLGGLITGQRSAYTYLPHSLTTFLTPDEIVAVMQQAGWHGVHYRRLSLGTVAVHVGIRK